MMMVMGVDTTRTLKIQVAPIVVTYMKGICVLQMTIVAIVVNYPTTILYLKNLPRTPPHIPQILLLRTPPSTPQSLRLLQLGNQRVHQESQRVN